MEAASPNHVEQFRQSFREEAREILTDLEAALLELNEQPQEQDLIGRVFRGLHTLKGSGAMFGFDALAAFTHDLETAFDGVRNGRFAVSAELVDLTLAALDQIKVMLEDGAETPAACAEILSRVRRMMGASGPEQPAERESAGTAAPAPAAQKVQREWHVLFQPGPDLLLNGTDPLLLLRELRDLGGLSLRACMEAVPALEALDPERCYVSWDMVLSTSAGEEAIRDIFIFVEDSCELTIEPVGREAAPAGPSCAGVPQLAAEAQRRVSEAGRRGADKPEGASSLRVPAVKLDQFVDLVGELVTVQARLSAIAGSRDDSQVSAVAEEIERLTSALRETSMNLRMMPVRATFEKFRRLVHDLARDLGKQVEFEIEGAETELDKTVIEQLGDPLMHLIRNSMDHGIEPPEARRLAGKPASATVRLGARHSGASVLIEVTDDGRGIDAEAVRRRALEKGLIAADAPLTEAETYALIFQPGFSTAAVVTDVSGRGVGMDVVRQNVEKLRGTIDVVSRPGEGTTVTLRLPLTLAIIDGLLVEVGSSTFVLPLASTLECLELTREDIARVNGQHLFCLRGEVLPYIRLREYFRLCGCADELEQIMVVETAEGRYGFVVDRVLGDCQTVIKNLGRFYRHVQVISGATVLGDGTVALIIDPDRLAQEAVKCSALRARGHPAACGPRLRAEKAPG